MKSGIGDRLKAARACRRLSLRQLARLADVSASLLSLVENGKANPSVESLYRIANALGTSVTEFFVDGEAPRSEGAAALLTPARLRHAPMNGTTRVLDAQRQGGAPMVTRCGDRPTIRLRGGIVWSRLTELPATEAEFIETVYPPGSNSGTEMLHHEGREFALVLEGELTLDLGFDRCTLAPGDSILFSSATPHRVSNLADRPMRAVWVVRPSPDSKMARDMAGATRVRTVKRIPRDRRTSG